MFESRSIRACGDTVIKPELQNKLKIDNKLKLII